MDDLTGLWLRRDLLTAGFCDSDLARLHRNGSLARVRRGAYVAASDPRMADAQRRHKLAVQAAVEQLPAGAVVSHASAAVMHGLPIWGIPLARVSVTRDRRSGGHVNPTLHVHTAPLGASEVLEIEGVPVTDAARTVVDLARAGGFEPAVVVADAALHLRLTDRERLAAAVAGAARRPGNRNARRVVAFADGASESVGESRSRVAISRARLPDPVLQWEVDGNFVDFGWPSRRTVGEFDGRMKYGRLLRPGQTPGDAVFVEKVREDAIRDHGLRVVRWIWADLDDFGPTAQRLVRAFG